MNAYEKIKELAKENRISIRQLEIRFGYSNGYLAKWKTNTPNADELVKLADYFGVSVDSLLGRSETKDDLSIEGRAIGRDYDALTPRNQELFKKMLAALQEDDPDDD